MTALAFVLAIVMAFYAGFKYERLLSRIKEIQELIEKKKDKEEIIHKSNISNSVIDPLDPIQAAKFEHDELMRKLNPNE